MSRQIELPESVYEDAKIKARDLSRRTGQPFDDLFQQGLVGALEALPRFDPSRGVRLETFLSRRVKGAMLDYCRTHGGGLVHVPREKLGTVKVKVESLTSADGEASGYNPLDFAEGFDLVDLTDWIECSQALEGGRLREYARLRLLEHKEVQEIAERFDLSSCNYLSQKLKAAMREAFGTE